MTNYRLSEYDRRRQQELNRANPVFFSIGYAVLVVGGLLLLTQTPVLDWLGL